MFDVVKSFWKLNWLELILIWNRDWIPNSTAWIKNWYWIEINKKPPTVVLHVEIIMRNYWREEEEHEIKTKDKKSFKLSVKSW